MSTTTKSIHPMQPLRFVPVNGGFEFDPFANICPRCHKAAYQAANRGGCPECRGVSEPERPAIAVCHECGRELDTKRMYCDNTCASKAYRRRKGVDTSHHSRRVRIDPDAVRGAIKTRGYAHVAIEAALERSKGWLPGVLARKSIGRDSLDALCDLLDVRDEMLLAATENGHE